MRTNDELIDLVASHESGRKYDAYTKNDNGHGPSFGLIQFNSQRGELPRLLREMNARDEGAFSQICGNYAGHFLKDFDIRGLWLVEEVRNNPEKVARTFKNLGHYPPFNEVQRRLANELYLEPAWNVCHNNGLVSERAVAMGFDICVQYGIGGLTEFIHKALVASKRRFDDSEEIHVLDCLAVLADTHDYDMNRRHKLLRSLTLSDNHWSPEIKTPTISIKSGSSPAVKRMQARLAELKFLPEDKVTGHFGPVTRSAVVEFQIIHGLEPDGICGVNTWKALLG